MSDWIERSEVLKQLQLNHKDVVYIDKKECVRRIEAIPSVSDRPKGKWIIEKTIYDNYNYRCNNCDWYETHAYPDNETYNFCPYCGADMRGNSK